MTVTRGPRVLQVVLSLHPGGTERLVIDLVSRLQAGIPMMVCCLDEDGAWAPRLREIGVEVHALGRRPGFHPGHGGDIDRLARRHEATVIHAHHYSPFVYSALARVRSPRTRLVFTEHGRVSDAPPSPRRRLANRVLSRLPHRVFAVSRDLGSHLVQEGFGKTQVEVIYNGIDVRARPDAADRDKARADLGVGRDVLVIGTVARLDPVKDLATLIDATALVARHRPVRLLIIGDGPARASLEQRAAAAGLTDVVTFLGHRDDARDWLPGCDVYVNSSISEGVSLTILEAMAAVLPVVATAVGGTPEVITPDCGVLVPARRADALGEAIGALGRDPARRETLGAAGRARVETQFSLDRMVREYGDVYREVA